MENTQLQPLAHSPNSAAARLNESVRSVYTHIATGELRSYKSGKRRLIPDTELRSFVERRLAAASAA